MKVSKEDAENFEKFGVKFWDYLGDETDELDILLEKTEKGHLEEYYNEECTFYYFVISGEGSFYIDREEKKVEEGDLIVAEPGTKVYYLGDMEILLISKPSWYPEQENHVRYVDENGKTVPDEERE
ncbi:MAG: hypothetical protein ABEJ56_00345 [Candidatus Nanohaloarchaea archaeon]